MFKYSPEEIKKLDLKPEDSGAMKKLSQNAEEVLKKEEEIAVADSLVSKAKEILNEASKEGTIEDNDQEEIEFFNDEVENKLFDDSSDFYTAVNKGSLREVFYKTVAEEIPELGITVDENAIAPDGSPLESFQTGVKTTPFKTDRNFLHQLGELPVIHALNGFENRDMIQDLEKKGILPTGMTDRIYARNYQESIKYLQDNLQKTTNRELIKSAINNFQEESSQLGNVVPLSNEEAQEIMRQAIQEEYKKELGI